MPDAPQLFQDDEKQDRENNVYNDSWYKKTSESDRQDSGVSDKEKKLYKPELTEKTVENITKTVGKAVPEAAVLTVALSFLKRNKSLGIFGVLSAFLVIIFILGFGFLATHELVDIEETLLGYETKSIRYIANKVTKRLVGSATCQIGVGKAKVSLPVGCSRPTNTASDTEPLADSLDNFDFENPEIQSALESQGIKPKIQNGKVSGFEDTSTGKAVSLDEMTSRLGDLENLGWNTAQVTTLEPLSSSQAGASFSGVSENAGKDTSQEIADETLNGTDAEANLEVTSSGNSENSNGSSSSIPKAQEQLNGQLGTFSDALNQADQVLAKGGSSAQAIKAATSDIAAKLGTAMLVTQILQITCGLELAAHHLASTRVLEIIDLLTRHASLLLALGDQLKSGAMTSSTVNSVMNIFSSGSAPFNKSASWLRMTGQSSNINSNPSNINTTSYTPDLAPTALPVQNSGSKLVNTISNIGFGVFNINNACHVINSSVGGFISGIFGVVSLAGLVFGDASSFGTATVAIGGALMGFQSFIKNVATPYIIKYFTPVGLSGTESGASWMNNADAGANLMFNNYTKRIGGEPLNKTQESKLIAQSTTAQNIAYASLPLQDRLFSFSDPRSLVSSLALSLPMRRAQLVSDIANYFVSFPKILAHVMSSVLFSNHVFAGTTPINPGATYDITQYGFTPNQLNNLYDPISNEQYLYSDVSYGGKTASRISLLGNPVDYPGATTDGNPNDILHCFTQGFAQSVSGNIPANYTSGNNSQLCGSEGNFNALNDNPQPINNHQVARAYCLGLIGSSVSGSIDGCTNALYPSAHSNNDILRFREYLLETSIMYNYNQVAQVP